MRAEFNKIGIRFIDPPPQCISAEKGLLVNYWERSEGDHVHANTAYGKQMAEKIVKFVGIT